MVFAQPLPVALSPSRLSDFQSCPRRYQHASVDRIPQPASYASTKGRYVHAILELLFALDAAQRTRERASALRDEAEATVLTDEVRADLELDATMLERLRAESEEILDVYFVMEDPRHVHPEGVELRLNVEVAGTPLLGILDRLDRDDEGNLVIVDYKTGSVPDRRYDSLTFANTELYAALCESHFGERPAAIRLLYVAKGTTMERRVSDVVVRARVQSAQQAWSRITTYYDDGDFPATPSARACRFCAYQERCRAAGVPVVIR
ncbi:MAG: PD-(D/E)XK nuclease family protein [Acidobacteriota bacterium]|nr:PD-(D/E)XK nuclease family protein [Acidobacteriota bacterium]MDE3044630.1 PD-(D/E)XK nuclease family protein [Acidobacteriota bacterium]MDE3107769.1 PD-(D/E)XK nuclease family protein [Acidobacteriota bacterium]